MTIKVDSTPQHTKDPLAVGIQIGASVAAVEAARDAILAILGTMNEEKTIRAALDLFGRVCEVKGAQVTNSTFTMTVPSTDVP